MSENTTAAAVPRAHIVAEVPDDDPEARTKLQELLAALPAPADEEEAPSATPGAIKRSLEDVLEAEIAEEEGGWSKIEWEEADGNVYALDGEVDVAGSLQVGHVFQEREQQYRRKHKIKARERIPVKAGVRLMAEALYDGHGVKGWRGPDFERLKFSRDEFIRLFCGSKRFRVGLSDVFRERTAVVERRREEERGN